MPSAGSIQPGLSRPSAVEHFPVVTIAHIRRSDSENRWHGAVLNGPFTSKTYIDAVPRNILVGPFWPSDHGPVNSASDREARCCTAASTRCRDRPRRGSRRSKNSSASRWSTAAPFRRQGDRTPARPRFIPSIDVANYHPEPLGAFKYDLYKTFGIESSATNMYGTTVIRAGWHSLPSRVARLGRDGR